MVLNMKKVFKPIALAIFIILSSLFVSCEGLMALTDVHIHACFFCGKDKVCKKYTTFWGKEIYYCQDCESQLNSITF